MNDLYSTQQYSHEPYDAYGYPDMRLFADFNSDRIVDWTDFGIHSASWQRSEDDPSYNWIVEYNEDGFIDWADYGAFASQWQYTVPPDEFSRSGNSYGFTGRRTDRIGEYELEEEDSPGSGTYTWNLAGEAFFLQYNRARYYRPDHGRWTSRDPAGYVDGMNLYEYVQSDPLTATDPLGPELASGLSGRLTGVIPARVGPFGLNGQYKDGMNLYQYVASNPARYVDPKGTDIYLKKGNPGAGSVKNALHQKVCVDTCEYGRKGLACFSFGKTGWMFRFGARLQWLGWNSYTLGGLVMKGEIYEDLTSGTVVNTKKTTAAQDKAWLDWMQRWRVGTEDVYSVGRHNCRTYSQWEFRDAP